MPFPPQVKAEALIACGRRCCICHRFCGVRVECHHIIPAVKGGDDTLENCIPLCLDCHAEVEHYNSQHPRGNKFTSAELLGHRNKWHQLLKDSIIQSLDCGGPELGEVEQRAAQKQNAVEANESEILLLCTLAYGSGTANETTLAQNTGINLQRTIFYMTELLKKDLVRHHGAAYRPYWSLAHEGRRFLIDNNLIG